MRKVRRVACRWTRRLGSRWLAGCGGSRRLLEADVARRKEGDEVAKPLACRLGRHKWKLEGPDGQHLVLRCTSCGRTKSLKRDLASVRREQGQGQGDWGVGGGDWGGPG